MTTPREDAIAARYVVEYDTGARWLIATEVLGPDEYGASSVVARDVGPEFAGRVLAALVAEAETPRPPSVRESSERLGIVTDPVSQRSFIVKPPPFEDDHSEYAPDEPIASTWVDLASPETAEALARALFITYRATFGAPDDEVWLEKAAAILAAMRETP